MNVSNDLDDLFLIDTLSVLRLIALQLESRLMGY